MTAHFTVTLHYTDELSGDVHARLDKQDEHMAARAIAMDLLALQSGVKRGYMRHQVATVAASQTVACAAASAVAATDTLVVAGTTLSAQAAVANESQFLIPATDTLYAAGVAACINAHSVLSKIVWASSAAGTLTITCKIPGPIGNLVTLAEAGNGFTLGAAALAGGASSAMKEKSFGGGQ